MFRAVFLAKLITKSPKLSAESMGALVDELQLYKNHFIKPGDEVESNLHTYMSSSRKGFNLHGIFKAQNSTQHTRFLDYLTRNAVYMLYEFHPSSWS